LLLRSERYEGVLETGEGDEGSDEFGARWEDSVVPYR